MRTSVAFCLASTLLLLGCTTDKSSDDFKKISLISPEGEIIEIQVEIADTPELREVGLMNRTELIDGYGMLFIFEDPAALFFWMKNTLIPLDIIFFDEAGNFVSSETMDPCKAEPCSVYSSDEDALYALEVNVGFRDEFGVGEGWMLEF